MTKIIRLTLCFLLSFWTMACSQQGPDTPISSTTSIAHLKAKNFAPGQLEVHYQKHGDQFGNITIDQYLALARELLNAPAGIDVLEKIRPNGDILHFRVSSREFAAMTTYGRIRTYFKTDMHYWMKQ